MAGDLQPLDQKFAIVDAQGHPTDYFIRWAQQKQIDIQGAITLSGLEEYLDAHPLQEGSGIQITPSGSLNDSPTIAADVQEILDQISTTQGSILYRNASDWVALGPGTAGYLLQTNGAGADPTWVAPAGGGAGDGGVLHLQDQRPSGVGSGNLTTGDWRSRNLNTVILNTITGASHVSSTVTITIASPGVITWVAHGLTAGTAVLFTTTGALPTGLTANTVYYVVSPAADTFSVSATPGGAAINTSGSQSGVHTLNTSRFILPAGTYDIDAPFMGHQVNQHQGRLQNLTDATTVLLGLSARSRDASATDGTSISSVRGRFTIAAQKTFELQHRCSVTSSYGSAGGWGTEIYLNLVVRKA